MKKIAISIVAFIVLLPAIIFAHSGNTDSRGGHYDYSTGEYHYHHGYSAHQHINGLCPYEVNLEDLLPANCPRCGNRINAENGLCCFECGYRMLAEYNILKIVDGPESKTRSQYFEEVQRLESRIETLTENNRQANNELRAVGDKLREMDANSIDELSDSMSTKNTIIAFLIFYSVIMTLRYISFKLNGNKKETINNDEPDALFNKLVLIAIVLVVILIAIICFL